MFYILTRTDIILYGTFLGRAEILTYNNDQALEVRIFSLSVEIFRKIMKC